MSCKSLLYMVGMFVFVPVWIGLLWTDFLKIRERASQLLHAWVLGFATMLAAAQLVLVPFVMMQKTLTQALLLWRIILQILAVLSFVIWLGRRAGTAETVADAAAGTEDGAGVQKKERGKAGTWTIVFGILAAVLILLQAYIPARYEHSDDDDSRFVAEEVSAVVHDTMYREDPITADYMYWDTGEVRKDLTSPWAMFVAMHAKEGNMAPAALSHAYLPFFLILICYALYLLIGQVLFGGDWEKTFLFGIVLSVLHLAGYTSTHTLASMLLLRIWQERQSAQASRFRCFLSVLPDHEERGVEALDSASLCGGCGHVHAFRNWYRDSVGSDCRLWRAGFLLLQELEKDACHLAGSRSVCDLFRILPDVGVKEWAMYWLCGENL